MITTKPQLQRATWKMPLIFHHKVVNMLIFFSFSEKTNLSFISCHIKQVTQFDFKKWLFFLKSNKHLDTNEMKSTCNKVKLTSIEYSALHHCVLALSYHQQHWASLSLHNAQHQQNGSLALQIFIQRQSDFHPHLFNAIFLQASPREGSKQA